MVMIVIHIDNHHTKVYNPYKDPPHVLAVYGKHLLNVRKQVEKGREEHSGKIIID
jgi:hypothetical protein